MTNACVTSIRSICHKPPQIHFSERKNLQLDFFRPLHNPSLTSLVYNSQPLTLTSQLSTSDTPAQRSEEWRRYELWHEKVFFSDIESMIIPVAIRAMEWGVNNESKAIENYKNILGREVSSLGFATHSENKFEWIGASPDGLLGCFPNLGILEVKCPFNKGKPGLALPWTKWKF
ncbi:hypothetical protein L1987_79472 [Smallanthus sonchifolius]|uniref:Uncharacterized protein n=1 Tax=Smallanthus sonchifolius TaxID=185202 RepID=A0ACB8ZFF3_9ASTR|nr:hypothetical protein L1987_79472 [Smallanthus sonchifolius]